MKRGQEFHYNEGTISYYQNILVKIGTGCTSWYVCSSNLNPALSFSPISGLEWEAYWGSSLGNHSLASRSPLHTGPSGYLANSRPANFIRDGQRISFQRPALYYIRHHYVQL